MFRNCLYPSAGHKCICCDLAWADTYPDNVIYGEDMDNDYLDVWKFMELKISSIVFRLSRIKGKRDLPQKDESK